jgi:hypothetical protein
MNMAEGSQHANGMANLECLAPLLDKLVAAELTLESIGRPGQNGGEMVSAARAMRKVGDVLRLAIADLRNMIDQVEGRPDLSNRPLTGEEEEWLLRAADGSRCGIFPSSVSATLVAAGLGEKNLSGALNVNDAGRHYLETRNLRKRRSPGR